MRFAPSESRVPPGLVNAPVSLLEASTESADQSSQASFE